MRLYDGCGGRCAGVVVLGERGREEEHGGEAFGGDSGGGEGLGHGALLGFVAFGGDEGLRDEVALGAHAAAVGVGFALDHFARSFECGSLPGGRGMGPACFE
jgi:hypothetical protein